MRRPQLPKVWLISLVALVTLSLAGLFLAHHILQTLSTSVAISGNPLSGRLLLGLQALRFIFLLITGLAVSLLLIPKLILKLIPQRISKRIVMGPSRQLQRQRDAAASVAFGENQDILQALSREQEKSEQLLLNILPAPIAQRLKHEPRPIAEGHDQVTVMFADIVGFTSLSTEMSPQQLVRLLNLIFSSFDQLVEQYQLEKIKTIGDAYMVAGGLPQTRTDHAQAMVELALAMQAEIEQIAQAAGKKLQLRIGMHTGPVVAGVIGLKKFSYDLWGDTVNIASRMESQGINGGIQISESTKRLLVQQQAYEMPPCEVRSLGHTSIKGKGTMPTYAVHALRP